MFFTAITMHSLHHILLSAFTGSSHWYEHINFSVSELLLLYTVGYQWLNYVVYLFMMYLSHDLYYCGFISSLSITDNKLETKPQ
jgi:hypothetical protein